MPRFFTLEQVREFLPRVNRLLQQGIESKSQFQAAESWNEEFTRRVIMMGGILADRGPFMRNRDQQLRSGARLKSSIDDLQSLGVIIKDLDVGLVDFPTLFHGDEVYVCWQFGEDGVNFWHGVNEGFAGRKPIDKDFVENHRGREVD
jgi:hypothetical protein